MSLFINVHCQDNKNSRSSKDFIQISEIFTHILIFRFDDLCSSNTSKVTPTLTWNLINIKGIILYAKIPKLNAQIDQKVIKSGHTK